MPRPRVPNSLLLAAGAILLLGTLVFLFAKSQSAGYKNDAQALALLRELRDMDARWDADGVRLANDLAARPGALSDRGPVVARIFQELENGPGRAAVGAQVPALRTAMAEKQEAFRKLRAAHGASMAALAEARDGLAALSMRAAAAKSRSPERSATLVNLAEQLRAATRTADIEDHAGIQADLEPRIASLVPAALALDPAVAGEAGTAERALRAFMGARASELAAWQKFTFRTVGARIDLAMRNLAASMEASLDEKDRWRAYLFAYAAALLLGVAYLAARVIATQAQLREANRELENRVAARTRDLETALRQLKESEAQLVQTEKMSSLGQLVAGVAHEINTPLAYVKNSVASVRDRMPELRAAFSQAEALLVLLRSETPDDAALQEAFGALSACLDRLAEHQVLDDLTTLARDGLHGIDQIAELVANLRNFSRLDRSKVASFNVNEGMRATLLIAKPALRKVDVKQELGEIPSITCSPSQVNQVILNLVTNAAQAIDKPRGIITLTTRAEGSDGVAIEVGDNGKGIPPENLQRIFDPFFTTKEVGKGTGLGLSIAYKIVAQHGGRIDVRSEVGVGSTFIVVLPLQPPAHLEAPPKPEDITA